MTPWPALNALLAHGLWPVYLVLFAAAFVKYTAPFLPGDMVLLISVFLVGVRSGSWTLAVAAITAGGTLGALLAFLWGRHFGALLLRRPKLGVAMVRVERMLGRWGYWPLVLNRFVPYVRPALFPAAGMLNMAPGPVALSALSGNLLFGGFVVVLGYSAGKRYARLASIYQLYQVWIALLVVGALSAAAVYLFWSSRQAAKRKS